MGMDRLALQPGRFSVDLLFFLIICLVLLNIIFGIIIDTFSDLRMAKLENQRKIINTCFICGIDRVVFDRAADRNAVIGFKRHILKDHSMWAYLYFMVFLRLQDRDDDDGLELYVRKLVEAKDTQWFPTGRALCLVDSKDPDSQALEMLGNRLEQVAQVVETRFAEVKAIMSETKEYVVDKLDGPDKRQKAVHRDTISHTILSPLRAPLPLSVNSNENLHNQELPAFHNLPQISKHK